MTAPWQMTRAEWEAAIEKTRPCFAQNNFTRASGSEAVASMTEAERLRFGVRWQATRLMNAAAQGAIKLGPGECDELHRILSTGITHRDVVSRAIGLGEDVPGHVLAEYPEFAREVEVTNEFAEKTKSPTPSQEGQQP